MSASVPREKRDAPPFQRADNDRVGGIAKRSLHANLARVRQAAHVIEAAAADDSQIFTVSFLLVLRFCDLRSPFSIHLYGFGFPLAIAFAQIGRRHSRIVTEKSEPSLPDDLGNPFLLIFERGHRVEIVTHNPRKREVRRGGHQIREEKCRLPAAGELHALHVGRVARHADHFHARDDRPIAFDERQLAGFCSGT